MLNNIQENLKPGISGIMRVKNDGCFIEACVESCIDALDELIIVWNDCTDNSADEIEKMRQRYPDKIKTYEYKYKVYSVGLTKEEYEYAKSLPKDSPHLLCNYYNFALSKVTYQYALKIDADQIYFTDKLKEWRNMLVSTERAKFTLSVAIGYLLYMWWKITLILSLKYNYTLFFPCRLSHKIKKAYDTFAKYAVKQGKSISLSGLNVIKIDGKWFTTLGRKTKTINILPPFNGEGDHLIFKVTPDCHYEVWDLPKYNLLRSEKYSLIEKFVHVADIVPGGFMWFHINCMRKDTYVKLISEYHINPDAFIEPANLLDYTILDIQSLVDVNFKQEALFKLQYPIYKNDIKKHLDILK